MAFQLSLGCRYGYRGYGYYSAGYGYYGYGKRKCCKDCLVAKCEKCQCQGFSTLDPTKRGLYPDQTIGLYCKAHRRKYSWVGKSYSGGEACAYAGGGSFVISDPYSDVPSVAGYSLTLDLPWVKVDTDLSGNSVCADRCTAGTSIPLGSQTVTRSVSWRNFALGPIVGTHVITFDVSPVIKCYAVGQSFDDGSGGAVVANDSATLGIEWNCSGYSRSGDTPPCYPSSMDADAIRTRMNAKPWLLSSFTTMETRGFPADEQCCCFAARGPSLVLADAQACRLPDFVAIGNSGGDVAMTNASIPSTRTCAFGSIDGQYTIDQASMLQCHFDLLDLAPNQPSTGTSPYCVLETFTVSLGEAGPTGGPFFLTASARITMRSVADAFGGAAFTFDYRFDWPAQSECPTGEIELPLVLQTIGPWGSGWALTSHTVTPPTVKLIFPPLP